MFFIAKKTTIPDVIVISPDLLYLAAWEMTLTSRELSLNFGETELILLSFKWRWYYECNLYFCCFYFSVILHKYYLFIYLQRSLCGDEVQRVNRVLLFLFTRSIMSHSELQYELQWWQEFLINNLRLWCWILNGCLKFDALKKGRQQR